MTSRTHLTDQLLCYSTIFPDEDDEDDDWFAPKGVPIKATDGSSKNVKITKPAAPK